MQKGILTEKIFKNKYSKLVFIILAIYLIFILFFNIKINMADRKFIKKIGTTLTISDDEDKEIDVKVDINFSNRKMGVKYGIVPIIFNEYISTVFFLFENKFNNLSVLGKIDNNKFNYLNFENLSVDLPLKIGIPLKEDVIEKLIKNITPTLKVGYKENIKEILQYFNIEFDVISIFVKTEPIEYYAHFKNKMGKYHIRREEIIDKNHMMFDEKKSAYFADTKSIRENDFEIVEQNCKKNIDDKKYFIKFKVENTFQNSYSRTFKKLVMYANDKFFTVHYFDENGNIIVN